MKKYELIERVQQWAASNKSPLKLLLHVSKGNSKAPVEYAALGVQFPVSGFGKDPASAILDSLRMFVNHLEQCKKYNTPAHYRASNTHLHAFKTGKDISRELREDLGIELEVRERAGRGRSAKSTFPLVIHQVEDSTLLVGAGAS